MAEQVDWGQFEGLSEPMLSCRCDARYRSHAKVFYEKPFGIVSQKPCPNCGRSDSIRKISHDPEEFTIRG